jgi:hypothetical protein
MGEPSSGLLGEATPPKSLTERLRAASNGHMAEFEVPALVMAERFAPGLIPPIGDHPPAVPLGDEAGIDRVATSPARSNSRVNRILLSCLLLLAFLPTMIFGLLYWRGDVNFRGSRTENGRRAIEEAPAVQQASVANMIAPETILPKQQLKRPSIALTVETAIAAEAGKQTPFAVALDGSDALPAHSIIIIGGLPENTLFSAGRPHGPTEWSLAPDEIGDLRFTLPMTASGQRALTIGVVAADGATLASGATRLEITHDATVGLIIRPEETARIAELLAHGRKMVEVGYVAGARGYFKRAAEAGSADAALAVGATYDPNFIEEIGAQGIRPDVEEARKWYVRAKALGSQAAEDQLGKLGWAATQPSTPSPH